MKKVIVYAATFILLASSAYASPVSVNTTPGSKVLEHFNAVFPNAKNVKWIDDKAGYFVNFTQDGDLNKVFYNTAGNYVYSLKYISADGLPVNIAVQLHKLFNGSKILGVTEITEQDKLFYNVKLGNTNKLYSVNILADGSILKKDVYDNGTAVQ